MHTAIQFLNDNNVKFVLSAISGGYVSLEAKVDGNADFDEVACGFSLDAETLNYVDLFNVTDLYNYGTIFTFFKNDKMVLRVSK